MMGRFIGCMRLHLRILMRTHNNFCYQCETCGSGLIIGINFPKKPKTLHRSLKNIVSLFFFNPINHFIFEVFLTICINIDYQYDMSDGQYTNPKGKER